MMTERRVPGPIDDHRAPLSEPWSSPEMQAAMEDVASYRRKTMEAYDSAPPELRRQWDERGEEWAMRLHVVRDLMR